MKKEIKLSDRATVTVTLTTEESLIADHTMTKPCCLIYVSATIDGNDAGGLGNMSDDTRHGPQGAVAHVGQLYLGSDSAAKVQAAIDEIKSSDYYVAWHKNLAEKEAAVDEYYRHVAAVDKMMDI